MNGQKDEIPQDEKPVEAVADGDASRFMYVMGLVLGEQGRRQEEWPVACTRQCVDCGSLICFDAYRRGLDFCFGCLGNYDATAHLRKT